MAFLSLDVIGEPQTGIRDVLPCRSLRDSLVAWSQTHYDLLIIAPQEFFEAVKPLLVHKNGTGTTTMLRTLEHVYQAYPGRDEAEKVKRCIAMFHPNNGVPYVMQHSTSVARSKGNTGYNLAWVIRLLRAT